MHGELEQLLAVLEADESLWGFFEDKVRYATHDFAYFDNDDRLQCCASNNTNLHIIDTITFRARAASYFEYPQLHMNISFLASSGISRGSLRRLQ